MPPPYPLFPHASIFFRYRAIHTEPTYAKEKGHGAEHHIDGGISQRFCCRPSVNHLELLIIFFVEHTMMRDLFVYG